MATQASLASHLEGLITGGGFVVAPSSNVEDWPSWAVNRWVLLTFGQDESGGVGGGIEVDVTPITVTMTFLGGNAWDTHVGERTSMTMARALRVIGEGAGAGVEANLVYTETQREATPSGLWRVTLQFTAWQSDTY